MHEEISERLIKAFPLAADTMIYRAIRSGILLADDVTENTPLLKNPVGYDLRGHLRRAGIMYQIHEYCRKGDLPFKSEINRMPIGHWHWVEIRSENILAHVCRTEEIGAFPVETPNRQDARLTYNVDLFTWQNKVVPISEKLKQIPYLYAWLMHGADKKGNLTHLTLGAPDAVTEEWLAHRNILESVAREDSKPEPNTLAVDPKSRLRFLDHVQTAIENQDNEKIK